MDIQTRINKINRDYVQHLKKIGGGRVSNNLGRPIGGAKQKNGGYSWEKFLDDTDTAAQTGAHIGHQILPLFGLGMKGKKRGGKVEPDYSQGEPVQNLTIQHLRDKKKDIYSPLGVLVSQYTKPEDMRDQSIRPDMPLDQTEVVKPPPPPKPLTEWQAFKKGMMIIPHAIGALLGGEEQPKKKRVYKKKSKTEIKGGNIFSLPKSRLVRNKYGGYDKVYGETDEEHQLKIKKYMEKLKTKETPPTPTPTPTPTPAPAPVETVAPTPTGGKRRGKKGGNFLFKKPPQLSQLPKPKTSFLKDVIKQINDKNAPKPTPTPTTPTPTPTTGTGKKKPSKWIEHVKAYAKKNNMKYNEALKDANCKKEYQNSK